MFGQYTDLVSIQLLMLHASRRFSFFSQSVSLFKMVNIPYYEPKVPELGKLINEHFFVSKM